jgi:hypothetical protein
MENKDFFQALEKLENKIISKLDEYQKQIISLGERILTLELKTNNQETNINNLQNSGKNKREYLSSVLGIIISCYFVFQLIQNIFSFFGGK